MRIRVSLVAGLLCLACRLSVLAQNTAFTYQGRLNDGANPASGVYDFRFALFDAPSSGSQQGNATTNVSTAVSNGLFTVTLDFGNQFPGADRWLELGVRTNGGGAFTTLIPRQQITATPYAMRAANATSAMTASSVAAGNISGTIAASQLPPSVLTNGASGVNISGTFNGNGAGVTNIILQTLNSYGFIRSQNNFVLASSPTAGGGPVGVASMDVNGDGKLDLIVANGTLNVLQVFTNTGSGDFALAYTIPVGNSPYSVVPADVNGDGRLDLISANLGSATFSVLTNNGAGGFGLAASPSVGGSGCYSAAVADVNGDGKPDLIGTFFEGNYLRILTNNGAGGFVQSFTPGVGSGPVWVVAADMNGDNKPDLISVNGNGGGITILTNSGTGTFVSSGPSGGSITLRCMVATDVNGDGKPDVITADYYGNSVYVSFNNGAGGISGGASYSVGSTPLWVIAADINGDAKPDIITANRDGNTLTVLTNNGTGGFALAATLAIGVSPYGVAAADVNGDGKMDLISANSGSGTLSVLFNNPLSYRGFFTGDGSGLTSAAGWVRNGPHISYTAGAVGIGTTPAAKLHVYDPAASVSQRIQTDGGVNAWSQLEFANANGQWNVGTSRGYVGDAFYIDRVGTAALEFQVTPSGAVYATSFNPTSDRNAKEGFGPVDSIQILDKVVGLDISRWKFKSETGAEHIGPMAQDFYAAFGTGMDDKHIATVDADGVALAAIQGLNQKLEEQRTVLNARDAEIQSLKKSVNELKQMVESLAAKK